MNFLDIALDAILDSLKTLPFLFAAFLLMEFCEHKAGSKINKLLTEPNLGVIFGSVLGIVPQCGFSAMAANLFAGGLISIGTLVAVFLSTSDEGLLILLGAGDYKTVIKLIICKLIVAIAAGYLLNLIFRTTEHKEVHDLCRSCGCSENSGILKPAIKHTIKIFGFLLIFTFIIGSVVELIGEDNFARVMLSGSIFQPFAAGILGLIPNCASSVILTRLYVSGALSFGSLFAGLSVNSGVALILLFRINRPQKQNFVIIGITYGIAVISGFLLQFILQ